MAKHLRGMESGNATSSKEIVERKYVLRWRHNHYKGSVWEEDGSSFLPLRSFALKVLALWQGE